MLYLESEVGGNIKIPFWPLVEYLRKYDSGAYVDLAEGFQNLGAHVLPLPKGETLDELGGGKVLNIITGKVFQVMEKKDGWWKSECGTFLQGNKRCFIRVKS